MGIMKCELNDYYKDGIGIVQFLTILEAFYFDEKIPPKAEIKDWELLYFRKNMWVIGFFEGVPTSDSYGISPRGMSFLCCRILQKRKTISQEIEESMARYILLKAITDIDWNCFSKLLVEYYVNHKKPGEIKRSYFPYDKGENFQHRWGFHRKMIEQVKLNEMVRQLPHDEIREDMSQFDPYHKDFRANIFFKKRLAIPSEEHLKSNLLESLKCYSMIFEKHVPFAYSEILKTIIQSALLSEDLFLGEPALCSFLIDELTSQKISLHRSSKDIKITGRGIYIWKNSEGVSYPFFELPNF